MTEIRVHDTVEQVAEFVAELRRHFDVVEESHGYPDRRGRSEKVRCYLDVRVRADRHAVTGQEGS